MVRAGQQKTNEVLAEFNRRTYFNQIIKTYNDSV